MKGIIYWETLRFIFRIFFEVDEDVIDEYGAVNI